MNSFLQKTIITCLVILFVVSIFGAFKYKTFIDANRLYNKGEYDIALKKYNEILAGHPDYDIVNFNIGAALYKKGDYQTSVEFFTKSLRNENPEIKSRANYNIGNSLYKQAQNLENMDLEKAADFYREAIKYYEAAIKLHKKDEDAKYNYDLLKKYLEVITKELHTQNVRKQKSGEKKQAAQKNQYQQYPSGKQQGDNKSAAIDKKIDDIKEVQSDKRRAIGQIKDKTGEMSIEDAELLLEEYRQREKIVGELTDRKAGMRYYPEIFKDW